MERLLRLKTYDQHRYAFWYLGRDDRRRRERIWFKMTDQNDDEVLKRYVGFVNKFLAGNIFKIIFTVIFSIVGIAGIYVLNNLMEVKLDKNSSPLLIGAYLIAYLIPVLFIYRSICMIHSCWFDKNGTDATKHQTMTLPRDDSEIVAETSAKRDHDRRLAFYKKAVPILFGIMILIFAIIDFIEPEGTKMVDDSDPFGLPNSGIQSIFFILLSLPLIFLPMKSIRERFLNIFRRNKKDV